MADTKQQHKADDLLIRTKEAIGKSHTHFTTDGLVAYTKSSKKIFGKGTQHHSHIHLHWDMNNNMMERFNGSFCDREIAFRGLKKQDTTMIAGYRVFYNYTRKHMGLDGITLAEASKIKVDGVNKWKTDTKCKSAYWELINKLTDTKCKSAYWELINKLTDFV